MNSDVTHVIINAETGQVVDELFVGDKIVKMKDKKAKMEYLSNHMLDFNKNRSFVKMFDFDKDILDEINGNEAIFILKLFNYISYEDGVIRRGGHRNGKILNMKDLSSEINIPYDSLRRIIVSLTKKGVLYTGKIACSEDPSHLVKGIVANPYLFMRGSKMTYSTLNLFENTKWANYIDKEV